MIAGEPFGRLRLHALRPLLTTDLDTSSSVSVRADKIAF